MTNLRLPIDGVFCVMEIWKDIPNYEGIYQVSSLGRVKSLGNDKKKQEKVLKPAKTRGYMQVILRKNKVQKTITVHQLVAIAFLGHVPCGHRLEVDHINSIKHDNRLENLQILSHRDNSTKGQKQGTSKYRGVSWCKSNKKWVANIRINNKLKFLGYFIIEEEASRVYQNKLKEILECNS